MSAPSTLPDHLAYLSTLVLVSRASASSSAANSTSPSGFTHARTLPLQTLSHLLRSYLHLVASAAVESANQGGRTKVSVWDVGEVLDEYGFRGRAGLAELREEAERGLDGVEEEAEQLADLAKGLQDHLALPSIQPPLCQLSYDPLGPSELSLLSLVQSLPPEDATTPAATEASSSDEEEEVASPPPTQPTQESVPQIKPESSFDAINGLESFALGDLGSFTGAGDTSFFDSLPLGSLPPTSQGIPVINGIGDITASVFHPLDLAGRPIADLSLLGPASLSSLPFLIDEEDTRPFPAWRDPAQVPSYVPPFFPPFPGMERESPEALARRRRRERERERDALEAATGQQQNQQGAGATVSRAAAALMLGAGAGGDPWQEAIPYSASSLATMANEFGHSLPTPSSPRSGKGGKDLPNGGSGGKSRKKRRRSLSPPPSTSTSLGAFETIQPLMPHQTSFLRTNQLRRTAAGYIAYNQRHPELAISSDSLFGSLPYAQPLRQPTLPPGFLPDFAPPVIHPFNTNLPFTVSNPVPYHPAASTSILPAPPPNPRVPAVLSSLARELSFPLQFDTRPGMRDQLHPNIALFARLRRIGPPGPLGPKGEALNYEFIGQTSLVALSNVEWPERRYNAKLPKRFGAEDPEAAAAAGGGGIKLKLGGGTGGGPATTGRQTREGSMAISTPWNTFGGSPAPFLGSGTGATPGPNGFAFGPSSSTFSAFEFGNTNLPFTSTAFSATSTSVPTDFPAVQPQADFDYPDFLLSAGGLSTEPTPAGGTELDWATVASTAASAAPTVTAASVIDPSLAGETGTTLSGVPAPPPPPPPPAPAPEPTLAEPSTAPAPASAPPRADSVPHEADGADGSMDMDGVEDAVSRAIQASVSQGGMLFSIPGMGGEQQDGQ
ncbi:proteophosphoglycan ppg4 [Rhodotorula toruloides]|uniref:Proteophosphoglycan ppg4 n=1 Tax=Rhodotorula toruloides TaxID=5286 RepID=A0A511KLY7_RHOTO|nr:proteophosphoglycan ppg4 [Rhodotorula toruloides]